MAKCVPCAFCFSSGKSEKSTTLPQQLPKFRSLPLTLSLVWVRGPWCECPCGWVWMCVRAPWKGLFLRCCKYEYRFNKACTVNQMSSSREPVCHILIRLRLIQDEENLLEMIIGHWLATHYIYHVQCNFEAIPLGGTLPLWGCSGRRWCITVHTFVLGLCCRWLCQQHWHKTSITDSY